VFRLCPHNHLRTNDRSFERVAALKAFLRATIGVNCLALTAGFFPHRSEASLFEWGFAASVALVLTVATLIANA